MLIRIASSDGTRLGMERLGAGPPLLAVHGSTADRSRWAPVRDALAERFTLYLLDRRGRGESTDEAAVHTLEREVRIGIDYSPDPARFASLVVPVRLLVGSASPPVFTAGATAAVAAIPGAELVELPGQGHGMIDADPQGFIGHVTDFFSDTNG